MLPLPVGLGPIGARAIGGEEHPARNEAMPVAKIKKMIFINSIVFKGLWL